MLVFPTIISAQTGYDALKMTQPELRGTARYMGIGGAFGALGGDATALKDNPAGLGVYRSSETTITLNHSIISSNTDWNNTQQKENKNNFGVNNFTYVMSIPLWKIKESGLLSSNFSFGFNRIKNFTRSFQATTDPTLHSFTDFIADFTTQSSSVYGTSLDDFKSTDSYDPYTNPKVSWLSLIGHQGYLTDPPSNGGNWQSILGNNSKVQPSTYVSENGNLNEYTFGWGGNFNNRLFLGINMNLLEVNYSLSENLNERFYQAQSTGFDLTSKYGLEGSGINLKIGAIYLPTDYIRIGAALHTPTLLTMSQYTNFNLNVDGKNNLYLPEKGFSQDIQLTSPLQAQGSIAFLFEKKGLIAAEYNFLNYRNMKFKQDGSTKNFIDANNRMNSTLKNGHIFKLGAEYKSNKHISWRAGYVFSTSSHNNSDMTGKSLTLNTAFTNTGYLQEENTQYFTMGFGHRERFWFLDIAYVLRNERGNYYPYQRLATQGDGRVKNILTPIQLSTNTHNIVATLGLKL